LSINSVSLLDCWCGDLVWFLKFLNFLSLFFGLVFVAFLFRQFGSSSVPVSFFGSTMGTSYSVKVGDLADHSFDEISKGIDFTLSRINQSLSHYVVDSELSSFNQFKSVDWFLVSSDFF